MWATRLVRATGSARKLALRIGSLAADLLFHLHGMVRDAGELGRVPAGFVPAGLLVEPDGIRCGVDAQNVGAAGAGFGNQQRIHRPAKAAPLHVCDDRDKTHDADLAARIQPRNPDRLVAVKKQEWRVAFGTVVGVVLVIGDGVATWCKENRAADVVHGAPFAWFAYGFEAIGHR